MIIPNQARDTPLLPLSSRCRGDDCQRCFPSANDNPHDMYYYTSSPPPFTKIVHPVCTICRNNDMCHVQAESPKPRALWISYSYIAPLRWSFLGGSTGSNEITLTQALQPHIRCPVLSNDSRKFATNRPEFLPLNAMCSVKLLWPLPNAGVFAISFNSEPARS